MYAVGSNEGAPGGTASALGPVSVVENSGSAQAASSAMLASPTATGRRITPLASRYQPSDSSDTAGPRRTASAFTRGPSSASSDGTTSTATSADSTPTPAPATPIE